MSWLQVRGACRRITLRPRPVGDPPVVPLHPALRVGASFPLRNSTTGATGAVSNTNGRCGGATRHQTKKLRRNGQAQTIQRIKLSHIAFGNLTPPQPGFIVLRRQLTPALLLSSNPTARSPTLAILTNERAVGPYALPTTYCTAVPDFSQIL